MDEIDKAISTAKDNYVKEDLLDRLIEILVIRAPSSKLLKAYSEIIKIMTIRKDIDKVKFVRYLEQFAYSKIDTEDLSELFEIIKMIIKATNQSDGMFTEYDLNIKLGLLYLKMLRVKDSNIIRYAAMKHFDKAFYYFYKNLSYKHLVYAMAFFLTINNEVIYLIE